MQTAKLGDTSLTITPIGLGLAALGRPGYINLGHAEDMRDDTSVAAMQARGIKRDEMTVGSKWGYT
ncbi:MAG TPA: hypothetical protein VLS48_05765 [Anaerolineales bacterium]|nr:hypothetical protein [Anaerolineales bacterium]